MISYLTQGWPQVMDVLSLLFITATATNLLFLWHGEKKGQRGKVRSPRTLKPEEALLKAKPDGIPHLHPAPAIRAEYRNLTPVPAPAPVSHSGTSTNPRSHYEAALRLIADGACVQDAANALRLPKGEIDLFLKLNRFRQAETVSI
jgi:hypothetical protein